MLYFCIFFSMTLETFYLHTEAMRPTQFGGGILGTHGYIKSPAWSTAVYYTPAAIRFCISGSKWSYEVLFKCSLSSLKHFKGNFLKSVYHNVFYVTLTSSPIKCNKYNAICIYIFLIVCILTTYIYFLLYCLFLSLNWKVFDMRYQNRLNHKPNNKCVVGHLIYAKHHTCDIY